MSSKPYIITEPAEVAKRYGNDKEKIQQAAMLGMVDPTAAVMAGMYIDRVERDAQAARARANKSTVAQDTFPQIAMAPQAAMAPTEAGVAALPVPDDMVPDEYAGGGIVAFDKGGKVSLSDVLRTLTMDEARIYQQTGRLPARAQAMLQGTIDMPAAPTPGMGKAGTGPATISMGGPDVAQTPLPEGMMYFPGTAPLIGGQAANVRPVAPSPSAAVEAIIAQAERGEGPNVSRPSQLPADKQLNRTPKGLAPQDTPFAAPKAPPSEVALITPQGQRLIPRQGMSVEDFKARQKEFGITDNVDADLKKQIDALAAGSKSEREQAKYMAMLQAGLGIMGGTSPNALQNISAGAQRGIAQYASDIKDIKKEERDLMKMRGELARAEDARKRGDFKSYMDAEDKARTYELNLAQQATRDRIAGIQEKYYAGRLSADQARTEIARQTNNLRMADNVRKARKQFIDEGGESKLRKEFEKRFGKNWEKDPMLIQSFNQQIKAKVNELAMMEVSDVPSADDLLPR